MKILFDLVATQPNVTGKMHGGGKYAIAVFNQIVDEDCDLTCVVDSRLYLDPEVKHTLESRGIRTVDLASNSLENILNAEHYDAYYTAMLQRGLKVPQGTRKICTIHGLRELEMPRDWHFMKYRTSKYQTIKNFITLLFYNRWRKVLLKRAKSTLLEPGLEYVTVSNHTKYSCLSFVPELKADNIEVCYAPSTVRSDAKNIKPYTTDYKYIFLVSGNRTEKNVLRVIEAMDEIYSEHPELRSIRVIITGAKSNSYHYKPIHPEQFSFLGYVSEDELDSLYKGAYLFVYPSLNEGFGYPPLEAMRFAVPVIASSFTSISEVCGDGAVYCNPLDYKEIKSRVLRLLTDQTLHDEYSKKGYDRYLYIKRRQDEDLTRLCHFIIGK